MSSTNFIDKVTPITASWLNDVNTAVYDDLGGPGGLSSSASDKGVSLINGAFRSVDSIAALKSLSKVKNSRVYVNGYYSAGDGGGGHYWLDTSDTTSSDDGGTIIVASDNGRWKLQWNHTVSILQFGVKADAGVTDNSVNLNKARSWILSNSKKNKLIFPSGIYGYSVSPNWAIDNAVIEAQGEVRLRYSGTGNAVIIDAGSSAGNNVYNLTMGRFHVEAPTSALNGVLVRGIHHSKLDFNVHGAGGVYSGVRIEYATYTEFGRFTVSGNEGGWYLSAIPRYGIYATCRDVSEITQYCLFDNAILEGVETGIYLDETIGNIFNGGTSEGCTSTGVILAQNARDNKFYGMDFEVNVTQDILVQGYNNNFFAIDSYTVINLGSFSKQNRFFGGSVESITCDPGSTGNIFSAIIYNRFSSSGIIIDNGSYNSFIDCTNAATGMPGTPPKRTIPSVGSSPYTYTNSSGNIQEVLVSNGSVTNIKYYRSTVGSDDIDYIPGTLYILKPSDALEITFSVAPDVVVYE